MSFIADDFSSIKRRMDEIANGPMPKPVTEETIWGEMISFTVGSGGAELFAPSTGMRIYAIGDGVNCQCVPGHAFSKDCTMHGMKK